MNLYIKARALAAMEGKSWEALTSDERIAYGVRVSDLSAAAHPTMPEGPWASFEDCPECGTHTGFPCVETDGKVLPGKRLGHAHTSRKLIIGNGGNGK